MNTKPCATFNLTFGFSLPFPFGFSLPPTTSFPPALVLNAIGASVPCCNFSFVPPVPIIPITGIPLTPFITAVNALVTTANLAINEAAAAAGLPSAFSVPSCP